MPVPGVPGHVGFLLVHSSSHHANAGMDLKSLQYLMGHADATVTLNVYTHASYEKAREAMEKVAAFTEIKMPRKLEE